LTERWNASELAPDVIGSIRVYKYLRMEPDGRLRSVAFNTWWRVKGPMTAECMGYRRSDPGDHRAPVPACRCGFYGYYLPDVPVEIKSQFGGYYDQVQAACEAEGTIIPNSLGVRAQKMTVLACALTGPWPKRRKLPDPGIPLFRSPEKMVKKFPPRDDISSVTGRTAEVMRSEWLKRQAKQPQQISVSNLGSAPVMTYYSPGTVPQVRRQANFPPGAPVCIPSNAQNVTLQRYMDGTISVTWEE
jgi:hypothetical protein